MENPQYLIFFIIFFISLFSVFFYGEILVRKGKAKEGYGVSNFSLYALLILTIAGGIFYLLNVLPLIEGKKEVFLLEFPEVSFSNFPPSPQYISVGGHYFSGPWKITESSGIIKETIFITLCRGKVVYVGEEKSSFLFRNHKKYPCWADNCKDLELNYAFLFLGEEVEEERRENIIERIKEGVSPPCNLEEDNLKQ